MTTVSPILNRIAEGTLIRNAWRGTDDKGRETACLYAALVPGATDTIACPAHLMPQWVADLTPWIDDAGTEDRWLAVVTRYAHAQRQWSALTDEQWSDISRRFRAECAISALASAEKVVPADAAYWPAVAAASRAISDALLAGREPSRDLTRAAKAAAEAADAAWAAKAAEAADAAWAAKAAEEAAWAAKAAAVAADAAEAAAGAAAAAAADAAEAADHLIEHFLTLVEVALTLDDPAQQETQREWRGDCGIFEDYENCHSDQQETDR